MILKIFLQLSKLSLIFTVISRLSQAKQTPAQDNVSYLWNGYTDSFEIFPSHSKYVTGSHTCMIPFVYTR